MNKKFNHLTEKLKTMGSVIVAFSGGVDSTFLLKTVSLSGTEKVLAVTGISESLPAEELSFTKQFTASLNITHRTIDTREIDNVQYASNPPDRCYYCKKELFRRLNDIAAAEQYDYILDGTNADDAVDWRPGRRAAAEEGVRSPLLEAGLSKHEIREMSRTLGLPTWDKPATPCLSSRFPYGQRITPEGLERVGKAETFIRKFGVRELRVRSHADVARIEVLQEDFSLMLDESVRKEVTGYLKSLGFRYITIDLQGFRSGSSNEVLSTDAGIRDEPR